MFRKQRQNVKRPIESENPPDSSYIVPSELSMQRRVYSPVEPQAPRVREASGAGAAFAQAMHAGSMGGDADAEDEILFLRTVGEPIGFGLDITRFVILSLFTGVTMNKCKVPIRRSTIICEARSSWLMIT